MEGLNHERFVVIEGGALHLTVLCGHVNRPAISRRAEALGHFQPGSPCHLSHAVAEVGADDDGTVIVVADDPVGPRVLDHPTSELAWIHLLRFPRVRVGDDEPAPRGGPCEYEDRRISINSHPNRCHVESRGGEPLELVHVLGIHGIGDRVLPFRVQL